jgi:hypothetical protein
MSYYDNITHSYTIVFQVQLYSPGYLSSPSPNGNQTEATMAATRSTLITMGPLTPQGYIPGVDNSQFGEATGGNNTRKFNHGDTFTAYDMDAYYLKQKYLYNPVTNPNGVLNIVSETA